MNFENVSRRSFLKKTSALAVGIASATIFSGIVNAADLTAYCGDPVVTAYWLNPQVGTNGENQCWTEADCNGVPLLYSTTICPNADEDYETWLACVSLEAKSLPNTQCIRS